MSEKLQLNPDSPTFFENIYPREWQMSVWEKHSFISLLQFNKPQVAIEIGNAQGGSLQVLSHLVPKTYALDISEEVHEKLKPQFTNVEFYTGDSKKILPGLLKKIQSANERLGFIFIDGDHSAEGVKNDINNVLENYTPAVPLFILLHDSFNPECRKGMLTANWKENLYVHYVDTDYVPGAYVEDVFNGIPQPKTMWGGFCMALLKPEKRKNDLIIHQGLKSFYRQLFKGSFYNQWNIKLKTYFSRLKGGR